MHFVTTVKGFFHPRLATRVEKNGSNSYIYKIIYTPRYVNRILTLSELNERAFPAPV